MEQEKKKSKGSRMLIVVIVVAAVVFVTGLVFFLGGTKYESTDNAQLDGDIISVRSGVTGYVKSVRFSDNQVVKKGDTLIVFDTDELKAKLLQTEAALDNAYANLRMVQNRAVASNENADASNFSAESGQQSVALAKVKLEKAQRDLSRVEALFKIKGATQEQVDNARNDYAVAGSEYKKALGQERSFVSTSQGVRAQARADQNQIDLARAQIKQKEAEFTLATKQLSYCFVIAPCNGIATKRSINPGQYLTTGQSMCAIVGTDQYWITANFKESQLRNIRIGDKVDIELDAYPDMVFAGKVESFGGATGAKFSLLPPDNATGNFIKITQRFPTRISIDHFPEERAKEVFPGLSAIAKVRVD